MHRALVMAVIACGDNTTGTAIDAPVELAYDLTSNPVELTPTLLRDQTITFEVLVTGSASAFPGAEQVPLFGDVFIAVIDPEALGGGALLGEFPGGQRYNLSNVFVPAVVAYPWYTEDPACNPGCSRSSIVPMTLADNTFGGIAPPEVTAQLRFQATLRGWVVDADSPPTESPSITLTIEPRLSPRTRR